MLGPHHPPLTQAVGRVRAVEKIQTVTLAAYDSPVPADPAPALRVELEPCAIFSRLWRLMFRRRAPLDR